MGLSAVQGGLGYRGGAGSNLRGERGRGGYAALSNRAAREGEGVLTTDARYVARMGEEWGGEIGSCEEGKLEGRENGRPQGVGRAVPARRLLEANEIV